MKRKPKFVLPTKYILLILSGVCIVAILLSFTLGISGGPLNTVAGYVFIPMQRGINSVGSWIGEKADNLKKLNDVMAENEDLKRQVDDLTTELNTIKLEQYELDNLRELLKLDQKYPSYDKVAANVIGKDGGNWFTNFTIDKGSNDGIEVDMNVIAGSGLVGIVTDVGPNYAKVSAIINDTIKVSGMVTTTSDNLIVNGSLQNMNENMVIEFSNLNDKDNKVAIGDPVVTSYVSNRYQQGILIGYINGMFRKLFYPEDIKLPLVLIAGSDLSCNLLIYFIMFLFRNRYDFNYYFLQLMIPELVYTMVITIFLYFIILKINQKLEAIEKRSASKFV